MKCVCCCRSDERYRVGDGRQVSRTLLLSQHRQAGQEDVLGHSRRTSSDRDRYKGQVGSLTWLFLVFVGVQSVACVLWPFSRSEDIFENQNSQWQKQNIEEAWRCAKGKNEANLTWELKNPKVMKNKCKKLNSLKHPVRTTVAGSHN